MNIRLVGIDLEKNVFQVCGVNKAGKVKFNKKVSCQNSERQSVRWNPLPSPWRPVTVPTNGGENLKILGIRYN